MKIVESIKPILITKEDLLSNWLSFFFHDNCYYEIIGYLSEKKWLIIKTNDIIDDFHKERIKLINEANISIKIDLKEGEILTILNMGHIRNSKELIKNVIKYENYTDR